MQLGSENALAGFQQHYCCWGEFDLVSHHVRVEGRKAEVFLLSRRERVRPEAMCVFSHTENCSHSLLGSPAII